MRENTSMVYACPHHAAKQAWDNSAVNEDQRHTVDHGHEGLPVVTAHQALPAHAPHYNVYGNEGTEGCSQDAARQRHDQRSINNQ